MALDQNLDGFADLPPRAVQVRLPLAAFQYGFKKRGNPILYRRRPEDGARSVRKEATWLEREPSSNQRSTSHSHQASKSIPAKTRRH